MRTSLDLSQTPPNSVALTPPEGISSSITPAELLHAIDQEVEKRFAGHDKKDCKENILKLLCQLYTTTAPFELTESSKAAINNNMMSLIQIQRLISILKENDTSTVALSPPITNQHIADFIIQLEKTTLAWQLKIELQDIRFPKNALVLLSQMIHRDGRLTVESIRGMQKLTLNKTFGYAHLDQPLYSRNIADTIAEFKAALTDIVNLCGKKKIKERPSTPRRSSFSLFPKTVRSKSLSSSTSALPSKDSIVAIHPVATSFPSLPLSPSIPALLKTALANRNCIEALHLFATMLTKEGELTDEAQIALEAMGNAVLTSDILVTQFKKELLNIVADIDNLPNLRQIIADAEMDPWADWDFNEDDPDENSDENVDIPAPRI